jgi:hypothetical protein
MYGNGFVVVVKSVVPVLVDAAAGARCALAAAGRKAAGRTAVASVPCRTCESGWQIPGLKLQLAAR